MAAVRADGGPPEAAAAARSYSLEELETVATVGEWSRADWARGTGVPVLELGQL